MIKAPFCNCDECPLKDASGFVPDYCPSDFNGILVIGEAPGITEVSEGKPFIGQSGQLLEATIGKETWVGTARANAVMCRPRGNAEPPTEAVEACLLRLQNFIEKIKPDIIVTVGKTSKLALLGEDVSRGVWQDYKGIPVMPTFHPAYVLRRPSAFDAINRDLRFATDRIFEPLLKDPELIIPHTLTELRTALDVLDMNSPTYVAFDTETDQINWYARMDGAPPDPLLMLALCSNPDTVIIIDQEMLYNGLAAHMVDRALSKYTMVGHNASFDIKFLRNVDIGVDPYNVEDTLLMHYVLNENEPHGLKYLAQQYLGLVDYEKALIKKFLRSSNDFYSKIPFEPLAKYCALDTACTLSLFNRFAQRLGQAANEGLWRAYEEVLKPAIPLMIRMETDGMQVDLRHVEKWHELLSAQIERLRKEMADFSGKEDFNPNSWKQLGEVIWDQLGLQPNKRTKIYRSNPRSTSREALEGFRSYDPNTGNKVREGIPFIDKVFEYRKAKKMDSSYLTNLIRYSDRQGRVHPDILLHGTEIGRLSVRNPAIQTIPRATDPYGAIIRSAFIAKEGHKLVVVDYSQAELRVLAGLSSDPFLIEVYCEGRDLHSEVARAMFGDDYTKEQRVMCKMFNFAYAYGGTEFSFARDAGLPLSRAKAFVRQYDKNMAVAKQWKIGQVKQAKRQGYVETRLGRRRRFPLITRDNIKDVRKAAVHMPVASTASDLTLLSAIKYSLTEPYSVVMMVHDSIIIEVPNEVAEKQAEVLCNIMKNTAAEIIPEVPWVVDADILDRWANVPQESALFRS